MGEIEVRCKYVLCQYQTALGQVSLCASSQIQTCGKCMILYERTGVLCEARIARAKLKCEKRKQWKGGIFQASHQSQEALQSFLSQEDGQAVQSQALLRAFALQLQRLCVIRAIPQRPRAELDVSDTRCTSLWERRGEGSSTCVLTREWHPGREKCPS